MIDPMISLSFAVQSNKGVYALLLGSGISRAASIPTGWEIVLDLIRQVAVLSGEECVPTPEAWYQSKYGQAPGYSKLLDLIAKTATERNQLLKGYFEPNEEERDRGEKLPTAAHRAIASLVASGHIKVIVTTNFDRLLESALQLVSVTPTVISTPDDALGAVPLPHNSCTIIKLHGDYLDIRIKNTPDELATYEESFNRLLDRIFDEYGLIVCGWSGEWDDALRDAIRRCPNRRFTTYWAARGAVADQAQALIEKRRAEVINISGADTFFQELSVKVTALEEFSRPHPLSKITAISSLKKFLPDASLQIRLNDLLHQETERVVEAISDTNLPFLLSTDVNLVRTRIDRYETACDTLISLMAIGCYWSNDANSSIWTTVLSRIANAVRAIPGGQYYEGTQYLKLYPALLLLYSGGIAAIASNKYNLFRSLLMDVHVRTETSNNPPSGPVAANFLTNWRIMDRRFASLVLGGNAYFSLNNHIRNTLREPLREFLSDEFDYDKCFDRFEYLWSLVCFDGSQNLSWFDTRYPGRFYNRNSGGYDIVDDIGAEFARLERRWPPLLAGLFGGDPERFRRQKEVHDQGIALGNMR